MTTFDGGADGDGRLREAGYLFVDRADAGVALARELLTHRGQRPLVVALPRGGVPVAREIAQRINADLDVLVARKVGAPHQEELAIGAVTADGTQFVNTDIVRALHITRDYFDQASARERDNARLREARLRDGLPPLDVEGRTVILVDDGLATGATMRAAIRSLRQSRPRKLIVAVPVGAADTCDVIEGEVDDLVCPYRPVPFHSVGRYYRRFDQTTDAEVTRILHEHRASIGAAARNGSVHGNG